MDSIKAGTAHGIPLFLISCVHELQTSSQETCSSANTWRTEHSRSRRVWSLCLCMCLHAHLCVGVCLCMGLFVVWCGCEDISDDASCLSAAFVCMFVYLCLWECVTGSIFSSVSLKFFLFLNCGCTSNGAWLTRLQHIYFTAMILW